MLCSIQRLLIVALSAVVLQPIVNAAPASTSAGQSSSAAPAAPAQGGPHGQQAHEKLIGYHGTVNNINNLHSGIRVTQPTDKYQCEWSLSIGNGGHLLMPMSQWAKAST